MPDKVLFLDFDGVLHPTYPHSPLFSQLPLLETVLVERPCRIVVSSSWRFHTSLEKIRGQFSPKLQERIIGMTGDAHVGSYARFHEIKAYVDLHGVLDWRALDDSYWEFPDKCPHLIRCNPNVGLTQRESAFIEAWLGG